MSTDIDHLRLLANLAGRPTADLSDPQVRRQIFTQVLSLPEASDSLRAAIEAEPDQGLASAVVVAMFDHLRPDERSTWVDLLPPDSRPLPAQRLAELDILDAYQTRPHATSTTSVAAWSDWLQLEIAATTFQEPVLVELVAQGHTHQVRTTAGRRLQAISPSPQADPVMTFHALAQAVRETADLAVGAEVLEPGLESALQLLLQNPDLQPQFQAEITSLLNPLKPGMTELVSYLMHELRWPAVESAIRNQLANPANVSYVRLYHSMLNAFTNTWPDRDLYARFE